MTQNTLKKTRAVALLAAVLWAAVPPVATAQGGGIQYSREDTRHFEGERFVSIRNVQVLARPSAGAPIVRDIPRMHMVYAKPGPDPRWLEVTGASAQRHPFPRQGSLHPVEVENGKLVLKLVRVDRNVYRPLRGYAESSALGSLDRPSPLPNGLLEQTVRVPGPLEAIGVPERRFVPKRPMDSPFQSVVRIQIAPHVRTEGDRYFECTGFAVGRPGLIATSGHCFNDGRDKLKISVMLPTRDTNGRRAVPISAKLVYWEENGVLGAGVDSALLEVDDVRGLEIPTLALATPGDWMNAGSVQIMTLGFGGDLRYTKQMWLKSDSVVHGDACALSAGQFLLSIAEPTKRVIVVAPTNADCITGPGDSGGPLLFWNGSSSRYEVMGLASWGSREERISNIMSREARELLAGVRREQEASYGVELDEDSMPGIETLRNFLHRSSLTRQLHNVWKLDERLYREIASRTGQPTQFPQFWRALLAPSAMVKETNQRTEKVNGWRLDDFRLARLRMDVPLPEHPVSQSRATYGTRLSTELFAGERVPFASYRFGKVLDVGARMVPEERYRVYLNDLQVEIDAMVKAKPVLARSLPRVYEEMKEYGIVEAGDDLFVILMETNEVTEVIRNWMNRFDGDLDAVRRNQGYDRSVETDALKPLVDDPAAPPASAAFRTGSLAGRVPSRVRGASTVSATAVWQALLPALEGRAQRGAPVVLSALPHSHGVPGAIDVSFASTGTGFDDAAQERLVKELFKRGIEQGKPVIVYGAGMDSWDAHNLVLRLVQLGFARVSWMREGIEGWVDSGLPVGAVTAK